MGPKLTQAEGMILGIAAEMFTTAGSVIVYGGGVGTEFLCQFFPFGWDMAVCLLY